MKPLRVLGLKGDCNLGASPLHSRLICARPARPKALACCTLLSRQRPLCFQMCVALYNIFGNGGEQGLSTLISHALPFRSRDTSRYNQCSRWMVEFLVHFSVLDGFSCDKMHKSRIGSHSILSAPLAAADRHKTRHAKHRLRRKVNLGTPT